MVRDLRRTALLAFVLAALTATAAVAADKFTLTRAIPADAFMAIHTRSHEGQAFLDKQYARVWAEIEKQRFDRDLKRLFKTMAEESGDAPEAFEAHWQKLSDMAAGVEWSTLGKREYAFGMKLGFPTPEFVSLMMPPSERVEDNFKGLAAILRSAVELNPNEFEVAEDGQGDSAVLRLGFKSAPFPIAVTVARHKDVLLVGFGTALIEQTLANLRGEKGAEVLSATPRFEAAFKALPEATDGMTYVDVARLMEQVRGIATQVQGMVGGGEGAEPNPMTKQFLELPSKIIDEVDMFDYVASVANTSGMKTVSDELVVLNDNAKTRALYPALFGGAQLKDPLKYIPKSAGDVSVTSGVDLLALYQAVTKFVGANVPDGQTMLDEFNSQMDANGLNLERDVLGWIGGGIASFSIPGPSPMTPGEFAFLVRVRDEAKGREMIAKLLETIEPMLGQGATVSDAEIAGVEGFRTIAVPMLSMFGMKSPTIGITDGWLFVGAGKEAIEKSLAAASGKAEDFSKNERYLKEGMPLTKDASSVSFTDMSTFSEQMSSLMTLVPLMATGNPEIGKNPVASAALRMAGKFGSVVRKLDFFLSSASQSTFDGKVVKTKRVLNYREPPAPPTTAPAGDAKGAEKAPGN